jgi:hypothetical protein
MKKDPRDLAAEGIRHWQKLRSNLFHSGFWLVDVYPLDRPDVIDRVEHALFDPIGVGAL